MLISHVNEFKIKRSKTIRQIANETGLSTATIMRTTKDATIGTVRLDSLEKIADCLGVSVKSIFSQDKES